MSPAFVLVNSSWPWIPTSAAGRDGDVRADSCMGSGELTVSADARVPAEQTASETSAANTVTTAGVRVTHRGSYLMLLLPLSCRYSDLRPGRLPEGLPWGAEKGRCGEEAAVIVGVSSRPDVKQRNQPATRGEPWTWPRVNPGFRASGGQGLAAMACGCLDARLPG